MGILKFFGVSSKKEKKLKETGLAVTGKIVEIAVNNAVTINGRNPRKLICEATLQNGQKRLFESSNVSAYVQPNIVGQPITVYLDQKDEKNYYVDVEAYK